MKKTIITLTAAAMLASASYGQTLLAGWNFDYQNAAGGTDIDNSDFMFLPETSAAANFGSGTLTWTGFTNGSGLGDAVGFGDNVDSNQLLRPLQLDDALEGTWDWFVAAPDASSTMTFTVDFTGYNAGELTFAYAHTGNGAGINVNVNGVVTSLNPGSDALATIDLSAYDNSLAEIVFSFTDMAGADNVYMDNFQFVGTAVPEPSAFAAIIGVVSLGFAAIRRRRS